jgi:hypothetical protein
MGLISSLIPHSFYRKEPPTAIPEIPKVSVIVDDVPAGAAEEIWEVLLGQPRTDFEMIVIADIDDQEPLAGASVGDPRLSFVTTMEEATAKARGEYTCFLNGHGAPSRDLLTNVIRRLDKQPMTLTATVGYALPTQDGGSVRSSNGARDIDVAWGREMPHCWFIRTRELRRLAKDQTGVDQVFAATRSWDANLHWPSAALRLPGAARSDRPEGFTHRSMGRQELATDVVTRRRSLTEAAVVYVRTRNRANVNVQPAPSKNETSPGRRSDRDRPTARYIGWSGHHNLGDELMLDSVRLLLPWADIETSGDPGQLLILGGGTLINRSSYLKQVTDRDTPRVERCVIGTGVANPDFWGEQEDPERWVRWLSSCAYVGVRGPLSFERLREWGFTGEMEISGDSALLLERPDVPRIGGRVVIAPAWTKGRLWGGSDDAVMEAMAAAVKEWRSMGREVVALASSPDDDGQILQIVERNDGGTVPFVQGYLDTAAAVELIASADVVVGERLHACVVAAAVGTPFVPVEYRPKLRDFAASVGVEQLVIRSDSISAGGLMERADEAMELPADHVSGQVNRYRDTLRAAGQVVERAVR